jgi:hypothetical protein
MKITRTVERDLSKEVVKKFEEQTVEVLYQRMGDRWYAFSLIDDEVFVGSISVQDLEMNQ